MAKGVDEYARTSSLSDRDELVVKHLWLVRHILSKIARHLHQSIDVENLESAGVLGLIEAANRFDPARGIDFKSYSKSRIRGAILDELRRSSPLPQEVFQQVMLVRKAQEKLDPPVTVEKLMAATGMTEDKVLDCLAAIPLIQVKSLENIEEAGCHSRFDAPEAAIEREELTNALAKAIETLPVRSRVIITLYFMEDLRLKEIGQVLGISESRVSRLLTAAQYEIREQLRGEKKKK